jgi:hypothetical protein
VAVSTTSSPPDKCIQQGGLSLKVGRDVKVPFGLVIDPLLQLCLQLIIVYPKRILKVSHRRWPMRLFTHEMIKMKHTNIIKLTEEEKWEG